MENFKLGKQLPLLRLKIVFSDAQQVHVQLLPNDEVSSVDHHRLCSIKNNGIN